MAITTKSYKRLNQFQKRILNKKLRKLHKEQHKTYCKNCKHETFRNRHKDGILESLKCNVKGCDCNNPENQGSP